MRKRCAILHVAFVESGRAAACFDGKGHVHLWLKAFVAGTIKLAAKSSGLVVV